jgi:predicted aspartyl protease
MRTSELGSKLAIATMILSSSIALAPTSAVAQSLPPCPADPTAVWTDCEGTRNYYNGDRYIGEFRNNLKNGSGTYIWADGRKYVGAFENDKLNGHGTYTDCGGIKKYVGTFRDNKQICPCARGIIPAETPTEIQTEAFVDHFADGVVVASATPCRMGSSGSAKLSQESIFDIFQRSPRIFEAWQRIVPPEYPNEEWIALRGFRTNSPVDEIAIGGRQFYIGRECKPHFCRNNYLVFLIAVDASEAYGMLKSDDLKVWAFLGRPDLDGQRAMMRFETQGNQTRHAVIPTATESSSSAISVPMRMEGGTYVVPVLINGAITLDFVVDSGAGDVSIPADVVMTLMRTGTLQEADFLEKRTYVLADGSTVPSQTFRIWSLKVGNKVVENVTGSVAPVKGSLLLGQSFLGRFGSWRVDNNKHVLILE